MSGNTRKASDEDVIAAYREHGSVWAAAASLGMCGQSVHQRLQRLGVPMPPKNPQYSDSELERIRRYYAETPRRSFSLYALSAELGRPRASIALQARKLGLTQRDRKKSDATRIACKAASQGRWTRHPHPRGALGLHHTAEARQKMSIGQKRAWITAKTFGIGSMSEEARQRRSDLSAARSALIPASNSYSRCRQGRRDDLGSMYFRSSWEANYARYLNWLKARGDIDAWEYEPTTFWFSEIKRGVRSYRPDFLIHEKGKEYFVEVKGWMDPKSRTKLKRMKKYHPQVEIRVVGERQYRQIADKLGRIIGGWE